MALTVGTNTYVNLEDADEYFDQRLYVDEWTDADDEDKEKALMMARRVLDRQPFVGEITDAGQMLAWPRTTVDGSMDQAVPASIIDAQCELALAFLREDLTADDGSRGVRRLQAGSVSIEFEGAAPGKRLPDAVSVLLEPFLTPQVDNGNSVQMVF